MVNILQSKSDSKQLVFCLFGDIHFYIYDQKILAELIRHCTINIKYSESALSLAGYEGHSNLALCNNACWALGELFQSCTLVKPSANSELLKNVIQPYSE
jgi:hypothetical protein